jgi:hypothetical protein
MTKRAGDAGDRSSGLEGRKKVQGPKAQKAQSAGGEETRSIVRHGGQEVQRLEA